MSPVHQAPCDSQQRRQPGVVYELEVLLLLQCCGSAIGALNTQLHVAQQERSHLRMHLTQLSKTASQWAHGHMSPHRGQCDLHTTALIGCPQALTNVHPSSSRSGYVTLVAGWVHD